MRTTDVSTGPCREVLEPQKLARAREKEHRIAAETAEDGHRRIIRVARLITEPFDKAGTMTFFVADRWCGLGLDTKLVNHIIEIGKDRKLERIYAELVSGDEGTIQRLIKQGFAIESFTNDL